MKYKDKTTPFSKSRIAAKDVTTLGGLTGLHRVYPKGHDSLHSFQSLKSGNRTFRYCFDFTLSPHAAWDSFKDFHGLFQGRSLTQYYICRIDDEKRGGDATDDILIQSYTDPFAEKAEEDEVNAAEILFSSPSAKSR